MSRNTDAIPSDQSDSTQPPILLTIVQFCERHSWARPGGLRHAIFNKERNGFDQCIVRFGRKLLLDEAAVIAWMRAGGGRQAKSAK